MSDRITTKDLEAVVQRINRTVNGADLRAYERTNADASEVPANWFRQVPNAYVLDGAYGGYALHRNCSADDKGESHGVSDVFRCGHVTKRELYNRMQAFLTGYESVSAEVDC